VFYLVPGLEGQARALVRAGAHMETAGQGLSIVFPRVRHFDRLAEATREEAQSRGLQTVAKVGYTIGDFDAAAVVDRTRAGAGAVVFLGQADDFLAFAERASAEGWTPWLLAPGSLVQRSAFDLPAAFKARALLSFASLPSDFSSAALLEFNQLHRKYGVTAEHPAAQRSAHSAALTLLEGLRRAPDLRRASLVAALEGLVDFQAGLSPPISYGPARRMGSLGAHVIAVDPLADRLLPGETWVSIADE